MRQFPVGEAVWIDYNVRDTGTGEGVDVDDLDVTIYPPVSDPITYHLDGAGTILFHDALGDYHALQARSMESGVWRAYFLPSGNVGRPMLVHWELMPVTEE